MRTPTRSLQYSSQKSTMFMGSKSGGEVILDDDELEGVLDDSELDDEELEDVELDNAELDNAELDDVLDDEEVDDTMLEDEAGEPANHTLEGSTVSAFTQQYKLIRLSAC